MDEDTIEILKDLAAEAPTIFALAAGERPSGAVARRKAASGNGRQTIAEVEAKADDGAAPARLVAQLDRTFDLIKAGNLNLAVRACCALLEEWGDGRHQRHGMILGMAGVAALRGEQHTLALELLGRAAWNYGQPRAYQALMRTMAGHAALGVGSISQSISFYKQAKRSLVEARADEDPELLAYLAGGTELADGHSGGTLARQLFERAHELDPNHVTAAVGLAYSSLRTGDYTAGWPLFEERLEVPGWQESVVGSPLGIGKSWQGEALTGKTIAVFGEAGFGDMLFGLRFLPLLRDAGARVVAILPQAMVRLAQASGVADVVLTPDDPPPADADYRALLLSVPGLLGIGTTDAPLPAAPYLQPPAEAVTDWAARLGPASGPRVALCWAGSASAFPARLRDVPLTQLARLASALPDAQWYAVQKGAHADDEAPEALTGMVRLNLAEADLADTAAVLAAMDTVVTVDTAVANLAGALGMPGIVLLSCGADWRWGAAPTQSPWYPSLQLVRQPHATVWPKDWPLVIDAARRRLRALDAAQAA